MDRTTASSLRPIMQIYDEYLVKWVALPRDPAYSIISNLKKKGFEYIVLPRATLRTGVLPASVPECSDYLASVRLKMCVETC